MSRNDAESSSKRITVKPPLSSVSLNGVDAALDGEGQVNRVAAADDGEVVAVDVVDTDLAAAVRCGVRREPPGAGSPDRPRARSIAPYAAASSVKQTGTTMGAGAVPSTSAGVPIEVVRASSPIMGRPAGR